MGVTQIRSSEEVHQFWLAHIQGCTEQGRSLAAYAKDHDLKVSALYYWNKRLRTLGRLPRIEAGSGFTAVQIASPRMTVSRYRVCFPNGLVLEWEDAEGAADLGSVIGVVGQRR